MKTMILLCAIALFSGCAYDDYDRGRPMDPVGVETGGADVNDPTTITTGREIPRRTGPGGLGGPGY